MKGRGFKKRGAVWMRPNGVGLSDLLYLQRSYYSEQYYLEIGKWLHRIHQEYPDLAGLSWDLNGRVESFCKFDKEILDLIEDDFDGKRMLLIGEVLDTVDEAFWNRFRTEEDVIAHAKKWEWGKSQMPLTGPTLRIFVHGA